MSAMPQSSGRLCLSDDLVDGFRVHEKAWHMPRIPAGPFARLKCGAILSVAGNPGRAAISEDEGATWHEVPLLPPDAPQVVCHTGALLCSAAGTVVLGFPDLSDRHWTWSDELHDAPGARLPTCAVRSTDSARTWTDLHTLHTDWTGATRDMIQTRCGRIVFTSMQMRSGPGRHTVMCYCSDDDGATWRPSNVMDLGGNGHHDGVTEGTIVELADGRLLQLLRTNWGQFWRAYSTDAGLTWHPYGPSGIEAASAPGLLERLASGRIALLWNRTHPEGEDTWPLRDGDCIWSATPASNFRAELTLSFSEDECESWSTPVVIARNEQPGEGHSPEASYPYAFEPEPGTLWVTAHRWGLRMGLREEDFVG